MIATRAVRVIAGVMAFVGVLGISLVRAQVGALTIADFDGEKIATTSGLLLMTVDDEQFGGTSRTQLSLIHPGAGASRGAVHIAFRLTKEFATPLAGAWALLGTQGLATDLSAYRGMRFHARSADGGSFVAGLVQYSTPPKRYQAPFETGAEWTVVDLPFEKFHQAPAPGTTAVGPADLTPTAVTSIGFLAPAQRFGEYALDVDGLEVYR
jgi:hypothetical protein